LYVQMTFIDVHIAHFVLLTQCNVWSITT
jgi:hypothetical protein